MLVSLRRPAHLIPLLALVVVAACMLRYRITVADRYVEEVVVRALWGDGPGQMALAKGADGKLYGPRSFDIGPDGRVYVVDSFNDRVQVFSESGQPEASISVNVRGPVRLGDISVDRRGRLFLLDEAGLRVITVDRDGEVGGVMALPPAGGDRDDIWLAGRMEVSPAGELYLLDRFTGAEFHRVRLVRIRPGSDRWGTVASFTVSRGDPGAQDQEGVIRVLVEDFAIGPKGDLVLVTGQGDPFRRRVETYDRRSSLRSSFIVQDKVLISSVAILGVDGEGHTYLALNWDRPSGHVINYHIDGRKLKEWPLPPALTDATRVPGRVDALGNVFLARTTPDGYEVVRWRHRRGLAVSARW